MFIEQVKQLAEQTQLWNQGDRIVLAVSGGPDSMAMLHIMNEIAQEQQLELIVAHVNHGFRPLESKNEQEMVRQYAQSLQLPYEDTMLDMPAYIAETKHNSQAASRKLRYQFLYEVAKKHDAKTIALAHHGDDQAETVLMHLLRGSGLSGLSGISISRSEKNMQLIRPLLRMNKLNLISYCDNHNIPYCHDSSNAKRDYVRNQIRLDVIPFLEQYNPQLSLSLQRLAELAGEEDDYLQQQTEQLFQQMVRKVAGGYEVDCSQLRKLHVALQRRLIKLILSYLCLDSQYLSFEAIERMRLASGVLAASTWKTDAGNGFLCLREYDVMRWMQNSSLYYRNEDVKIDVERNSLPYSVYLPGWHITLEWKTGDRIHKIESRYEALFDGDHLSFPLRIRYRQNGDRMNVLGLNGSKKVQDMFVDAKVAPSKREVYPLLVDDSDRLLWIPGIRRSSHALSRVETTQYLKVTAYPMDSEIQPYS